MSDLTRIADALERIADNLEHHTQSTINITGPHPGDKEQLATTIRDAIRAGIRKGAIPPDWAA